MRKFLGVVAVRGSEPLLLFEKRVGKLRKLLLILLSFSVIMGVSGVGLVSAATSVNVWTMGMYEWIPEALTRFNKVYPDIKVTVTPFDWPTIVDKFIVSVAGGTPPDLFICGTGSVITFAAADLLMPLDDILAKAGFDARHEIFPGYLQASIWQNKIFGIPLSANVCVLLRYSPIFEESGMDPFMDFKNWEELGAVAQRLSQWSAGKMVRTGLSLPYTGPAVMHVFMTLFPQYGGQPFTEDGKRVLFDSIAGRRAMEIYVSMFQKYKVWVPGAPQGLSSMKVAIAWGGYENIMPLEKMNPGISKDIILTPPPVQGARVYHGGGATMMIPKNAKHPEEAFKLMMFLLEPDIMRLQLESGGRVPPRRALLEADWVKRERNLVINVRAFEYTKTSPPHPDWVTILPIIEQAIPPALKGEVPPDRAVEDMARKCNAAMEAKRKQK